ncbi:unnamed protein product, partial [Trichogramma brassicae]
MFDDELNSNPNLRRDKGKTDLAEDYSSAADGHYRSQPVNIENSRSTSVPDGHNQSSYLNCTACIPNSSFSGLHRTLRVFKSSKLKSLPRSFLTWFTERTTRVSLSSKNYDYLKKVISESGSLPRCFQRRYPSAGLVPKDSARYINQLDNSECRLQSYDNSQLTEIVGVVTQIYGSSIVGSAKKYKLYKFVMDDGRGSTGSTIFEKENFFQSTILLDALDTLEAALLNTGDTSTFAGALGYSVIDLTFDSNTLVPRITSWAVSELYTHSDHQAIVFEIATARPPRPTMRQSCKWNARTLDTECLSAMMANAAVPPGPTEEMATRAHGRHYQCMRRVYGQVKWTTPSLHGVLVDKRDRRPPAMPPQDVSCALPSRPVSTYAGANYATRSTRTQPIEFSSSSRMIGFPDNPLLHGLESYGVRSFRQSKVRFIRMQKSDLDRKREPAHRLRSFLSLVLLGGCARTDARGLECSCNLLWYILMSFSISSRTNFSFMPIKPRAEKPLFFTKIIFLDHLLPMNSRFKFLEE